MESLGNISLLDCTLRDGGYINDWNFGHNTISSVYKKLSLAGTDYIEVGFLDERRVFDGQHTIVPKTECFDKIFKNIPKGNAIPVAMIDFGTCGLENISDCSESFIDGIRVIFKKERISEAMPFCKAIKDKGYKLFIQAISITSYSDDEMLEYVKKINEIEPYAFSIVDTYGLLDSKRLTRYFELIDRNLNPGISMGYHGHNNFQLAFSNTIKFMEFDTKRHRIVDSTVYGMGKSAGNCASELLSLYLNNNYEKKYDVSQYLEILDTDLMPIYKRRYWGYAYNYYISAMENCHPNYVQYLLDKRSLTVSSVNEILEVIPDEKKLHYDAKLIENIYIKFQSRMDTETCNDEELKELLKSKEIILLGPGSSIKTYGDYISMIKKDKDAVMIATNFMPEGLECEYVFVSNAKRYSRLVDSLNGKIMNYKLITTSNVNCFDVQPDYMINYHSLINPSHMIIDNALILCISMLVRMGIKRVSLAGFDGFANMNRDYFDVSYSFCYTDDNIKDINEMTVQGLKEMCKIIDIEFLTPSIYQEHMVNGQEVEV